MAQPALNVDYPVQLGPSFQGQGNGSYATMRYDFKPASVKGSAVCRQQGNKVSMHLLESNGQFTGKLEPCQGDLDCVAIFDGTSWRLEVLSASIITKFSRTNGGAPALASTPEIGSQSTLPSGSGATREQTPTLSDGEMEVAGPRPGLKAGIPATQHRPSPSPPPPARSSPPVAEAKKSTLGKRPAPAAAQKPAAKGAASPDKKSKAAKTQKQPTPSAPKPVQKAPEPVAVATTPDEIHDSEWDAAFADLEKDLEVDESGVDTHTAPAPTQAPVAVPSKPAQAAPAPPAPAPRQPTPPPPAPAPKPAQPAQPPLPAARTPVQPAQPASKPPAAPQPGNQPAAARPAPAAAPARPAPAPAPAPAKPAAAPAAKSAADPWNFEGMDDDDDDDFGDDFPTATASARPAAAPLPPRGPRPSRRACKRRMLTTTIMRMMTST